MLIWGSHWTFAVMYTYLTKATTTKQNAYSPAKYTAPAAHHFVLLPERLHLESWIKVFLPCVAILLEIWLGHPQYRCMHGGAELL